MPTNKIYGIPGLIAVLGLLTLLVGFIIRLVLPDIRYAAWGILTLGILLLATAFIIDFRRVGRALTGRRGRFSTGTTVMASIFIGITLLVNAISIGNYQRIDLTSLAQFTLTSQTKEVLRQMATPAQLLLFFTPADPYGISGYVTGLLAEYQNYTDQLSIKTIDPDEHPDQARQYGITQYQTVVFETEKGRRLVSPGQIVTFDAQGNPAGIEAEHAFTSALLEVTGITQKKVYFLSGHGEGNINTDYSSAKENLLDNLYKVATLDLLVTRSIPEDCAALIIAAPRQSLDKSEVEIIKNYLENDGWLMILANPESPPEIRQLLSTWGVDIEDGTIIDPSSYVSPSTDNPIVPRTRNFFGLSTTYFPGATAIIPQPGYSPQIQVTPTQAGLLPPLIWSSENSSIQMVSLLRSSQDSWLTKDFSPDKKPQFNEGADLKGPLNIGFLIVTTPTQGARGESTVESRLTRLIVIGDSDFASNQHFYNGDNGNFFLNSVNLLTTGKELISIERKVLPFRRLVAGPEITNFIRISSLGLLPLIVLLVGGIIWWRRR